jgi:hypothetical protein
MTKIHVESRTIHDIVIDPDHTDRTESEVFRKAKERLKEDGHYKCWVCGTDKNIQIHHFVAEYMFETIADLDKAKEVAETFDIYGYGKLLKNQSLTSIEDVRCLMALCQIHHTGVDHEDGNSGTGIHSTSFPTWLIQRVAKDGMNPVPQPGRTDAQALETVKEGETS